MRVVILPTELEASNFAGQFIADYINNNNNPVIGLATGGSVLLTYDALISSHKEGKLSFSKTVTFNLDEYIGLEPNHNQSYRQYMKKKLFDHIDIDQNKTFIPECFDNNFDLACSHYENEIKNHGGIGLQLLGIGSNGHIGFNEPTSSLQSRTRVKTLQKIHSQKMRAFLKAMRTSHHWLSRWELEPSWRPKIFYFLGLANTRAKLLLTSSKAHYLHIVLAVFFKIIKMLLSFSINMQPQILSSMITIFKLKK